MTRMAFNNPTLKATNRYRYGRQMWTLVEPLQFTLDLNGGQVSVTVPPGYETDFASIPRLFWSLFPPSGRYWRASIVHDYLYSKSGSCSRFLADSLFREGMSSLNIPWYQRVPMFYAVRVFGALTRWAA